ncbi:uncharacterized protein (DUF302 family) [Luteibacter sp. HA06]|jgi:uncharacterized protein (DUF302 family)
MPTTKITNTPVTRIRVQTAATYEEVVEAIYADIGREPVPLAELTAKSGSWDEFEATMTSKLGPSGFMIFGKFDHGAWVEKAGIKQGSLRVVLGNPMIAITLLRHGMAAGLFVPVELLVLEEKDCTSITYLQPSTLLDSPNEAQLQAAQALDAKLDAFVQKVANSRA